MVYFFIINYCWLWYIVFPNFISSNFFCISIITSGIIDIPIVLTIVSLDEPLEERMLHSGASIVNVSGGKKTVEIVKALRKIDKYFPIIATGGPNDDTIREVILAGANAITYTPPTNGEIFKEMMERYRIQCSCQDSKK